MTISVHQPQYLPWLGYFDKIIKSDCFVFLDTVQYKQREFQNRNKIRTKEGFIWLTVPVLSKGKQFQRIDEVEIDTSRRWQAQHMNSLKVWYGQAPFFDAYKGFFEDLYARRSWERLTDLNLFIIEYIIDCLRIDTPVLFESQIGTSTSGTERIIELCKKLKADTYLSGTGGKDYLDEKRFIAEGIKLEYQQFKYPVYRQCFAENAGEFISHLSVIDLLLNEGPRSREILEHELPRPAP